MHGHLESQVLYAIGTILI